MTVIIDDEIYIPLSKVRERIHKKLQSEMKDCDSEEEKHGMEIAEAEMFCVLDRIKNERR